MRLKSEKDLQVLRSCADIVSQTLAEVGRLIEPGITTEELDRHAERVVRENGGVPAFKGYRLGNLPPFPGTLCVSVNDEVVHGLPGPYVLRSGDVLSVDCGVSYKGFYGDSAFTFAVGEISEQDARLCRVTYEALQLGVEAARPGRRLGDVGYAVQQHCERHGYGVVRELVGHGIGHALHEDPEIPNVGRRHSGRKFKSGMVFCLEPMVNQGTYQVSTDSNGWTVRTADGAPSAHYEHMVAVGPDGPEVLTSFHYIENTIATPFFRSEPVYG